MVVNSEDYIMPRNFFQNGLRLNAADYNEMQETVMNPWIDLVFGIRTYAFQHDDDIPANKNVVTQDWMVANLHDEIPLITRLPK